jgi:hypothetical protein
MAALEMEDGKRAKNMIKKLKLAADAGRFSEMRLKISSHRDQLALLVELLTVYGILPYNQSTKLMTTGISRCPQVWTFRLSILKSTSSRKNRTLLSGSLSATLRRSKKEFRYLRPFNMPIMEQH